MEPSQVFRKIFEIQDKEFTINDLTYSPGALDKYQEIYQPNGRIVYIIAEIRPESLDNGADPTPEARNNAIENGGYHDIPAQYIVKELGGIGEPENVFPMNGTLDLSTWKADQSKVYDHVSGGSNRHARLIYGIKYEDLKYDKYWRPRKIYYYFKLFENGKIFGLPIANVFVNKID